jgi:acetate kinase
MHVLVFNCGSSSLKFELIEVDGAAGRAGSRHGNDNPESLSNPGNLRGLVESIGKEAHYTYWRGAEVASQGEVAHPTHEAAARHAIDWMRSLEGNPIGALDAVAHRIVHGGGTITQPAIVDDGVLAAIERASIFAPLHNPPALATLRAVIGLLPGIPQVVIADTGFHETLPPRASTYAIPKELAARHGIRRFGFHGIGHSYMMDRYAEISRRPAGELNLITLQLGAGCSIAAIERGRSVDTSMGLTPLEGLMMATRSGDLDPAIPGFIAQREGLSPAQVEHLLNHESGLLGVSAVSSDMREVEAAAAGGNQDAALALEMFYYRARKYIGAYLAVLGRADAIIFSAGIGEHSSRSREQICAGLEPFGILIDPDRNRAAKGESRISADDSRVEVWTIPMDEELQMARLTAKLLHTAKGG